MTIRRQFADIATGAGYTVKLRFIAIDGTITTLTATEDVGDFVFAVLPASLVSVTPGVLTWAVTAEKSTTERYTLEQGVTQLDPDPSNTTTAATTKLAHVERVIAICEAALESKLTDDMQMYQLPGGVTVSKLSIREVRETLAAYNAKRKRILNGGKMAVREVWYAPR